MARRRQVREIGGMSMMISSTFGRCAPLRIIALSFALSTLAGLSGCYSVPEEVPAPPPVPVPVPQVRLPPPASRPKQELASWYGPGFNGRRTTTGERFNENAMTAASKTLPLGSHVVVTNPQNGRSVEVRINDRGPHVRGRTLDLSKRAAQKLGITKRGVARVEITPSDAKHHPARVAPIAPSAFGPTPVQQSHI
jgi:rare lipoprotein A